MQIRAVSFDIGHTLVDYKTPLNWRALYRPALRHALAACEMKVDEAQLDEAESVLLGFNTRVHPREYEVASNEIFGRMLAQMGSHCADMRTLKREFYGYFKSGACCYDDAEPTLAELKRRGMLLGALTDVAYEMDDEFSLADIAPIQMYFDAAFTSVAVGYRKPHPAGYQMLLESLGVQPEEMLYVGDEKKDIEGANQIGIVSVLIDRGGANPDFGQVYTISALCDIRNLI